MTQQSPWATGARTGAGLSSHLVALARRLIIARNHIDHAVTTHPSGADAGGEGSGRSGGLSMQVPTTMHLTAGGQCVGGEPVTGAHHDLPRHGVRVPCPPNPSCSVN